MANKHKNEKSKTDTVQWKVGITPEMDVFVYFSNGDRHFQMTMDGDTPMEFGKALIDVGNKRKALVNAGVQDVVDPIIPTLIPLKKPN